MEKLLTLYTTVDEIWSYKNYRKDFTLVDVLNPLKSIRVLVLVLSWKITDIPDCISELRHLRYLDVRGTKLIRLPDSLCHLYNLQMLAAPDSYVKLPIDIVNISSLRNVRASLSTCKGVGKLTSLQELSSIHVCEGDNIRELGDMQRLRGELTIRGLENVEKLEDDIGALMDKQTLMDKLVLEFDKQLEKSTISEEVLDALGCPPNLTNLRISGYNGLKSPSWIVDGKHKFDKLQTLTLIDCRKLESLPPLGEFANFMTSLSHLEIKNCNGLKRLQLDALVSLKELDIRNCSSLVQITSPICESFKIMTLVDCESLRSLSKLRSLERLGIESLKDLKSLPTDFHKLSSLEELIISHCPQLQSLPPDFHKLSSLKTLRIYDCPQLQSLPPDFHKLSSLKNLSTRKCPQLQIGARSTTSPWERFI